ncbi:MAG: hypothetical protein CFE21_16775 [Bacteroidetes bacterium B1(2017)]|nr:MAG: hypothetical protein CFE21_16775 [Bacteroidetes bacterium B1(2017)]
MNQILIMKSYAVLIDFTEGAKIALNQAQRLAHITHAKIVCLNIANSADQVAEVEKELELFVQKNSINNVPVSFEVGFGNIFSAVPELLKKIDPSLAIICTHGVKGMFQHLFGAHILKLVQALPCTCIVLQENNKINLDAVETILMPIGPHPDFELKIKQTAAMALELNAPVTVYEIDKPGLDLESQLDKNKEKTKSYFTENKVPFYKMLDGIKVISVGYSRQTLEYARENSISLISLMSNISKNDLLFGVGDKENFLVNPYGIPVLCCK